MLGFRMSLGARRMSPLILVWVAWLVAYGASPADAAVINVTTTVDGGPGSLRAAFDTANANAEDDTIVLQAGATYELTVCGGAAQEDANADGDLDHTAPHALHIEGNGATIRNTCVDERIMHMVSSGALSVSDVTMTGGDAPGDGGAIESVGAAAPMSVTGGTFVGNQAEGDGGALESFSSPISVSDSTFTQNKAGIDGSGDGGALETSEGAITVLRSTLLGNTAGGSGGGIRASVSNITVTESTISGNQALGSTGGGISTADGPIEITRTTISGNTAADDGGAVRTSGDPMFPITVTDSTISGNTSGADGGAFRSSDSPITLRNTTVSGNSAASDGGAVRNTLAPLTANNVTFQGNSATTEGQTFDADAVVELSNTIVAGAAPACTGDGPYASGGYNIGSDASCNLTGPGDKPSTDPKLGPLADNGGPTQTHALLKGSPAIDAGNPAAPGSGGGACEATDQRGLPRNCDAGAYELVMCAKVPVNRIGTGGKDVLRGTGKADGMLGLGGKDRLIGKGGKDGLCGGPGKDKLSGGGGKDTLNGQGGKDVCNGGPGRDRARKCEKTRNVP